MTDSQFDKCLRFVLSNEGGLSSHSADRGGITKYGITSGTLANAISKGVIAPCDIKDLTVADAGKIYDKNYWTPALCGTLPFPLSGVYFDAVVNHGQKGGKRLLQKALAEYFNQPALIIDGILGPVSKHLMSKITDETTARRVALILCKKRKKLYDAIIANNPSQKVFQRGWYARVERNIKFAEHC